LWGNSRSLSFITIHQRLVQRINKDASLTNELKNAMKMGNGSAALDGGRIWKKSKEIKRKLISHIAPLWPVC
jgi:hypothetical protein